MRRWLFAGLWISLSLSLPAEDKTDLNHLSRSDVEAGWISLFDGQTLFGWKKSNESVNWTVSDGTVWADSGEPGLLLTPVEFGDFELQCDFRLSKGGNSGIFLRTLAAPKDPSKDCYELNMCDTHPAFPTGSLVGVVKPGTAVKGEDGAWHHYHVTALGKTITVELDGKEILKHTDERPGARVRGYIGLQKNAGKAEYRNVFLKPLGTEPLFNGKDLAGWHVVPGGKSTFDVEQGRIHVKNGRGFLETDKTFGDFVLQAQVQTNGQGLNSGIFFRAMRGTEKDPSNGYEFQIHNGYKENNRTSPADFGTGGIYRLAPARKVVSNDREWTALTLVASGNTTASWVNGELVTVFTDTRAPHENPRKGLRTEAGHFSLQGHDPTTDLLFKDIRACELPKASVAQ